MTQQATPSTVGVKEFTALFGTNYSSRQFWDAMRAGQIPVPLNSAANAKYFIWGRTIAEEFVSGRYKGAMLPAGVVPPARPAVGKPAKVQSAKPAATRGPVPASLPIPASDKTQEFVLKVHTDGSITVEPSVRKN